MINWCARMARMAEAGNGREKRQCSLYLCSLAKGHFGCHSSGNWFTLSSPVSTQLNNSKRIEKQQQWLSFTCQQHLLLLLLRYDTTTTILLFSLFYQVCQCCLCSTTLNESCYRTCSTERQKRRFGKSITNRDRLLSFALIWFHTHVPTTLLYFLSRFFCTTETAIHQLYCGGVI